MLSVPTVHLNGTSKQELLDQLKNAFRAVREAEAIVRKAYPHGRDYYVQTDTGGIEEAMRQHGRRLVSLNNIANELEAIAIAVQEQGRH